MTNEDHVAALTAVFDRIKIANPLGLPLDADGLTNIATIIAAVLTYSSGLHMLEQTAVSSRSGVSVIDIPSKEKK